MIKPIYVPKGAAQEYGDYAINIYTGCPHRCYYCFAPTVLRRDRELFHSCVMPRKDIVEATRRQLEREAITGKTIHLCFTCDPYPTGYDTTPTRDIIKLLKESGNHVQVLTKGNGMRDFDLLDENDWYGITYAGYKECANIPEEEPCSASLHTRLFALRAAHEQGIKTWVSMEPVINAEAAIIFIQTTDYVDLWKVGKLNYHPSDIDWRTFGERVEKILQSEHRNYYIKNSLKKAMNK